MPHFDAPHLAAPHLAGHGRRSEMPDRAACLEMLEAAAAGAAPGAPFGDALALIEAACPPPPGRTPAAPPRRGIVRFLTCRWERRRMDRLGDEGSGGGGRDAGLPDRGVPA